MSSPFLGSFILSWPLINYKLMFVVFGEGKYYEKIDYIGSKLYNYKNQDVVNLFLIPFLVGMIYTFAYPFFDRWLTKYTIRFNAAKAKMTLLEERKIPFDQNAQVEYFLSYENDKVDLQKLVKTTNDDSNRKSVEHRRVAVEIFERLMKQTVVSIAASCEIESENCPKLKRIIIGNEVGEADSNLMVVKLKKYKFYKHLRNVAKEMVNIDVEDGTIKRIVTLDWVGNITGVSGDNLGILFESLLALEIIQISSYFPLIYMVPDSDTAGQINRNFSIMDYIGA